MNNRSKMLANESIGKLLLKLSAPAMVGMMVQALYNLVDTIYIGNSVGIMGIAGITISFPIQMIVMAIAQTVGIGGASIISRSMGAGDMPRAEKTMGNVFLLLVMLSFSISVLGSIYITPILKFFGATETILPYSVEYLSIILFGTIFFAFAVGSNGIIRAEGNAKMAMITMLISGGLNIILDPIFIFVLDMGIRGAALATVISQASTVIYLVYYFLSGKSAMKFHFHNLKLDTGIVGETFAIGASAFSRQAAGSIMAIVVNNTLSVYGGDAAIAVFGTINRMLMFTFMPLFGVVQGLQPIVGFNYGAKQYQRVKHTIWLSIKVTTLMSCLGFLLLMLFPSKLTWIFNQDPEFISSTTKAIRVIIIALPLIGFQVVGAGMYQAIGKALPSLILSMSRQILFLIPLIIILPRYFQLKGVWMAFPIADFLSALLTFVLVMKEIRILNKSTTLVN